jgi:SAM-dependent methyltransferase
VKRLSSQVKYVLWISFLRVPWIAFAITALRFILFKSILRRNLHMWAKDKNRTIKYEYSKSAYTKFLIRPLTRSVIPISLASSLFWPEPFDKKLLIIGPRYESDYFLARGYGFAKENITLIDHFSYSKKITLGDAHDLDFTQNSFDVVIASWMLVYSTDQSRVLSEIRRVLKPKTGVAIITGDCHPSPDPFNSFDIDSGPYLFDAEHLEKLWPNPTDKLIISWPTANTVIASIPQVVFAMQKSNV